MCLIRVLAVLKAAGIVARRCIFAERGALEDGHPIAATPVGTSLFCSERKVDAAPKLFVST